MCFFLIFFREQPIFTCKAHVFHIDPKTKRSWLPASSAAVNVSFFYDSSRALYRIISVEGTKVSKLLLFFLSFFMYHYSRLPHIWSKTHFIPGLPVPLFLSPWTKNGPKQIWSPRTNGSLPIWSPYFWITTACPPGQIEYSRDDLSRGTKLVGDHVSMGTKCLGTIIPCTPN